MLTNDTFKIVVCHPNDTPSSPTLPTFHKHPEESGEVEVPEESHREAQGPAAVEEITLKME